MYYCLHITLFSLTEWNNNFGHYNDSIYHQQHGRKGSEKNILYSYTLGTMLSKMIYLFAKDHIQRLVKKNHHVYFYKVWDLS